MVRRDEIILRKVLEEIKVAEDMLDNCSPEAFLENEMLKRAAFQIRRLRGKRLPDLETLLPISIRPFVWKMCTTQLWLISRT